MTFADSPRASVLSVDAIIPLYNKGPYVEQAVRSALQQTYAVRAVVVVDDASTDDGADRVRAMARDDRRVRFIASNSTVPQGQSVPRNRAIASSDSELVAFLDADDYWDRDKLEAQLPLLDRPGVGAVHCGARTVDAAGRVLAEQYPQAPLSGQRLFDAIRLARYGVTGSASGVLTRRSLLDAVGPFQDGMNYGEDWDMWSRLAAVTNFAAVPRLLTNIRSLDTPSRARPPAERFIDWLRVFDRWRDDDRFMRLAVAEARGMVAPHQLGMLLDPGRAFVDYPRAIAASGGELGRRLFGSPAAYWTTLATMLPLLAVRAARRAEQELGRMRA